METVIVLPIYMALIGGIMWSGQLIYEKQKLLVADRYVTWNYGHRYPQKKYDDVQKRFFDKDKITLDTVTATPTKEMKSSPWWHEVQGAVELDAQMPVWTRGWFYGNPANSAEADKMPASLQLFGRDLSDGKPGGHTVVMQKMLEDTRSKDVDPDKSLEVHHWPISKEHWPDQ
jgi:hypothetical protein